jgi:hypothetical protein
LLPSSLRAVVVFVIFLLDSPPREGQERMDIRE